MKTATPQRLSHITSVIKHENSLGTGKQNAEGCVVAPISLTQPRLAYGETAQITYAGGSVAEWHLVCS